LETQADHTNQVTLLHTLDDPVRKKNLHNVYKAGPAFICQNYANLIGKAVFIQEVVLSLVTAPLVWLAQP